MAGADVIGTAVCIILLVVVCYTVVGSIMLTSGVIINSQNDMTQNQQEWMQTSITVADYRYSVDGSLWRINVTVLNNGNQVIENINETEMMMTIGSNRPVYYQNGLNQDTLTSWYYDGSFDSTLDKINETLNPGQWDPGEYLVGQVWINGDPSTNSTQVQVVLQNGMTAMNIIPIDSG